MNTRQSITRNITYSLVTIKHDNGEQRQYTVYGETTPAKEMKKLLKDFEGSDIPVITVEVKTEQRVISLEDFINHSIIINESEEK
jgi:hypothetical protein